MKKTMFSIAAGLILGLFTLPAAAQKKVRVPSWVSDKGYWVVESNIHSADSSIIYYYDNENHLVYQQRMEGVVKTDGRRAKRNLTKMMEKIVGRRNETVYRQMMGGESNPPGDR